MSFAGLGSLLTSAISANEELLASIEARRILRLDLFAQEEEWAIQGSDETFSEWRARLESRAVLYLKPPPPPAPPSPRYTDSTGARG